MSGQIIMVPTLSVGHVELYSQPARLTVFPLFSMNLATTWHQHNATTPIYMLTKHAEVCGDKGR